MAVNDEFMLPMRVRMMEPMADLLDVEQTELTQIHRNIESIKMQLVISSSTYLLSRHEKIMGLFTNLESSVDDRRSCIIAKLMAQGTATKALIRAMAENFSGSSAEVTEYPMEYRFQVKFTGIIGVPPSISAIMAAIDEVKPAHLQCGYTFTYRTWDMVGGITWGGALGYTWDQLRAEEIQPFRTWDKVKDKTWNAAVTYSWNQMREAIFNGKDTAL